MNSLPPDATPVKTPIERLLREPAARTALLAKLKGKPSQFTTTDIESEGTLGQSLTSTELKRPKTDSIWQFLLRPIEDAIASRVRDNSLLPIFLLENPYPAYGPVLLEALKENVALVGFKVIDLDGQKEFALAQEVVTLADSPPRGVLLFGTSRSQLPRGFRSVVRQDGYLTIPALTFERLAEYAAIYRPGLVLSDAAKTWVRWIGPQELIVANTLSDSHWESGLGQLARQRVGAQLIGAPRKMDELYGVEAAKHWALQLFSDIALARDGKISWREVDRGALLSGPPGTGKTTLARAIAFEAGTNFIAVSPVKDWMTGSGLDESIKQMSATFSAARQQSPSIVFIDEIDSVGNRESFTGQNASWNTAFLNALLTELDGFEDRDQIIVIGATNFPENVDAALRRAGRLERLIRVERPSSEALASMYKGMLKAYANSLNNDDFRECAGSSLGLTGADVELLVRGARRRARLDCNRAITKDDVLDEIYRIPPDAERRPLKNEEIKNTAYHEAGHALVGLLLPTLKGQVRLASIIPNNDGALGFVALTTTESNETRESLLDRICMALAGRAAEELIFTADKVSTGAGGAGRQNDLAMARRIAQAFAGIYGFSQLRPNWWSDTNGDSEKETQEIIATQYQRALGILKENQIKLDQLAGALLVEHVLTRDRLIKFIDN
jgi:AAA+ superfamily predicted ATPase